MGGFLMQKSVKLFGAMFAGFGALAFVCAAFAADATPRSAPDVRMVNRASVARARMPSMPIMTINPANLTTTTGTQTGSKTRSRTTAGTTTRTATGMSGRRCA